MARIIKETARGIDIVDLEDVLLQDRYVFLTGEITPHTTNEVIKQLMHLQKEDVNAEITIFINSPGGEVSSGMGLYDYMSLIKCPICTVCLGTAASMAAILYLAGTKRQMLPHTRLMIHDPSYGNADMSGKKPHEIQHELDKLNETREIIAGIIAQKTGKSIEEVYKVSAFDTFFSAEEALKWGLATEIIKPHALKGGNKNAKR